MMAWFLLSPMLLCILSLYGEIEAKKPNSQGLQITPRIVGGTDAVDGQIPFQGSLQINKKHKCGCVVITSEWLLTAAHCITANFNEMEVLVGTVKLSSIGGTRHKVKEAIKHTEFKFPEDRKSKEIVAYDIAVIRLDTPIQFNDNVQPIEYSIEEVGEGENLQVSGWGLLKAGGERPDNLQVLNVTSITNEECGKRVLSSVHESILCSSSPVGQGVCLGDSGGPLVLGNKLVGIVNWSISCARGYPDGFARISYHHSWFEEKMGLQ